MKLLEETCDRSKTFCERIIAYVYSIVGSRKCVVVNGEEFLIGRRIAEGAFSYVYVAQSKQTGKHFALKRIITQTKEQRQGVNWEIQVHETFNHPNLLKLCGFVTERQNGGADATSLLFPLCSRGSLESALQRKRPQKSSVFFTESESIRYLNQVCEGLKLFHNHSPAWAHMDIKPGNVLLDSRGKPVLMDFGSTSIARKTPKSRSDALRIQEWAAENCSMPYRAPELFEVKSQVGLTESVDIWSLGCFLYGDFLLSLSLSHTHTNPGTHSHLDTPRSNVPFRKRRVRYALRSARSCGL